MLISPLIVCTHATWSFITGKYARRQSVFVQNGLDYSNKSMEVGEMVMSERINANHKISYRMVCELYRLENKYWKTGDTDILPKCNQVAMEMDERSWSDIKSILRIVILKHYPIKKFAEALSLLGFDVEEPPKEVSE